MELGARPRLSPGALKVGEVFLALVNFVLLCMLILDDFLEVFEKQGLQGLISVMDLLFGRAGIERFIRDSLHSYSEVLWCDRIRVEHLHEVSLTSLNQVDEQEHRQNHEDVNHHDDVSQLVFGQGLIHEGVGNVKIVTASKDHDSLILLSHLGCGVCGVIEALPSVAGERSPAILGIIVVDEILIEQRDGAFTLSYTIACEINLEWSL